MIWLDVPNRDLVDYSLAPERFSAYLKKAISFSGASVYWQIAWPVSLWARPLLGPDPHPAPCSDDRGTMPDAGV